jgi:hypothetical protein
MIKKTLAVMVISVLLLVPTAVLAQEDEGLIPDNPPETTWKEFLPKGEEISQVKDTLRAGAEESMKEVILQLQNYSYQELYDYLAKLSSSLVKITGDEAFIEMMGNPQYLSLFNEFLADLPDFASLILLSPILTEGKASGEVLTQLFDYTNKYIALLPLLPEIFLSFIGSIPELPKIIASAPIYLQSLELTIVESIPVFLENGLPILFIGIPRFIFLEMPNLASLVSPIFTGMIQTFGTEPLTAIRELFFGIVPRYGHQSLIAITSLFVNLIPASIGILVALALDVPVFLVDFVAIVPTVPGLAIGSIFSVITGFINLVGLNLALLMTLKAGIDLFDTFGFITEPVLGIMAVVLSLIGQLLTPKVILNLVEVAFDLLS